jgi:ATP-dependent Clp protease ATP-binding subunit ClpB
MYQEKILNTLNNLESTLAKSVKGQGHIIPRIVTVLKRGELRLTNEARPKGNFLFLGPTGTGKTEITKAFTKALYTDPNKLIRFDMSEYQTKESLTSLLGDPSGWNGRLGEALIANSGSIENSVAGLGQGVLLFDEMEKAHKDMLDIFLQIMDDARVTTGTGVTHKLSGYYVVLTSNVGAEKIMNAKKLNFATIERTVRLMLTQKGFRPEFIGRFQEVLVFNKLSFDVMREIAELNLNREISRVINFFKKVHNKNILLEKTPDALELCVMQGSNTRLGARPMRNFVEKSLQDAVAEHLLKNKYPSKAQIIVQNNKLVISEVRMPIETL